MSLNAIKRKFLQRQQDAKSVNKKCGVSGEYVCISINIRRKGEAYVTAANRATMGVEDLTGLFADHIARGALVFYNGLKNHHNLSVAKGCTVKDGHKFPEEERGF